ncbi:MAG: tetratricopeptide repeat protein [Deltaproteobacteria bacterium]|nr:tetratricopeptide repeat protein [Deltaproteobacteria bacterium]
MRRRRHRHGRRHREERAEPIEFVQELIEAGKLDEARRLLDGLEGDEAVLESFRGILDMKAGRPERAIAHFERVLVLKPTQTAVWLYLGQARFQTGRFRESLRALEKGAAVGRKLPAFFQLKARAEKELGLVEAAYGSLEEARGLFPGQDDLVREQALLLVGEGLYAAALSKGQEYLARRPEDRDGYLILGEALRKAGRPREAAVILEQAALRFDQDPEILARLAFAYSTDHRTLAAARLFAKATRLGGEHAFAAAEHFRLAGRFREAMQMNARVQDPKKKLSQRLAIYLGSAHFSRAAALEGALVSATALDDTCRYRLAYANLRTGDLQTAERLAREVEDAALKESAGRILARIAELRARQAGTL